MSSDTIVALSTPPGVAALAVIRLSGPESHAIIGKLVTAKVAATPGHAHYRTLAHQGKTLDDAVLTFWRAPHSYTGEDTVEISCHGNPHIVESVVRACLELGARAARPGEFTQRAFLNDKLSLTQAEGLLDLLYAPTERALASARAMKEGKLGEALEAMRAELVDLLSHLEASLDFAEEGIEPRVGEEFTQRVQKVRGQIGQLIRTAPLGRILQEGALTVIVGEPNVGKSSLLNALLREDRAIVAPTPGTTRDLIDAMCSVRGLPLRLIDTAGQRDSTDPVEIEGNRRARALLPKAQLLLHVVEAHVPYAPAKIELPADVPQLLIANKADLGRDASLPADALFCSPALPTKPKPRSRSTRARTPPSSAPPPRSIAPSKPSATHAASRSSASSCATPSTSSPKSSAPPTTRTFSPASSRISVSGSRRGEVVRKLPPVSYHGHPHCRRIVGHPQHSSKRFR
jgi:tRNA modification GTPase